MTQGKGGSGLAASRSGSSAAAQPASRVMPSPFYVGSPLATTVSFAISERDIPEHVLRDGERWLGRFILPPFQRPPVWTREQQIKLIESVWLELPIGVFIYNQPSNMSHPTDQWLIDGQQRITALLAYVADEFPVFGYRYSEITEIDRRMFQCKHFPCVQLAMTDAAAMEDIYMRLAYGGTPHEPLADRNDSEDRTEAEGEAHIPPPPKE